MLGHSPLGTLALGQLPQQAADALAPGAALPLTLSLAAGAAVAERPPLAIIGRPLRVAAEAPGAALRLRVQLMPGAATADAAVRGAMLRIGAGHLSAGSAAGEGQTEYDNAVVLLLAA